MSIKNILENTNIFWQYPVITEKVFYEQNQDELDFLGFPWATVLDKRFNGQQVFDCLRRIFSEKRDYYTCCQHINFRRLIPLWKGLGIKTLYTSHKKIGEDEEKSFEKNVQIITDKHIQIVDDKVASKEKEIMTI